MACPPPTWAERFQPFAGERWWVLLPPVVTLVVLLVVAALLVRRDLGAGALATRLGPATAPSWLRSPLGLAWRLRRDALLGWTLGSAVAGLSFGLIAQDMVQFAEQDPETAELLRTLGGGGSIADIFLAAVGALLFGVLPRLVVGATWAVLAVVLFVTVFGEALQFDRWLLDLSAFAHLPRLPGPSSRRRPCLVSSA